MVEVQGKKLTLLRAPAREKIVFDENHFSGTTDLSKAILSSYSTDKTIKIYLTATYSKPLQEWNIPSLQIVVILTHQQILISSLQSHRLVPFPCRQ